MIVSISKSYFYYQSSNLDWSFYFHCG